MKLDLHQIPFSRYGAYLAFSFLPETEHRSAGLYLRSVHGGYATYQANALRIDLLVDGDPVPFEVQASPAVLTLTTLDNPAGSQNRLQFTIPAPPLIRIRGEGVGLRLTYTPGPFDSIFPIDTGRLQFNCATWDLNFLLTALAGSWRLDAPWQVTRSEFIVMDLLPDQKGICEAAFEEFESVVNLHGYPLPFDECIANVDTEFRHFSEQMPLLPDEYEHARKLAAYVNWSSVVEPSGLINWPAMLMSKNWMTNVWSWDHCFNAMALTYHKPVLAWDQIRVVFDQQNMYGGLPDSINDRTMIWSFVKPPIHGWALNWMMDRTGFIRKEQLHQIYGPLCRWTEWWFTYRDYDHDGIPQYNHGNDSGWDNATIFYLGMPIESPDLSTFLVLQMETLARVAERLGNEEEAESWQRRSEELLNKMLAHFWQDDHFVAMRSGDHVVSDTDSLILYLPLLLGKRLPTSVRRDLLAGLTRAGRFITDYGLATESTQSPAYNPDGYWRGPIWAPSTMLMVEALAACGEHVLARSLARKFCDMVSANGFAENYDSLTGEGLRDRAYTWTSSVFLILGHEYLHKK